MLLHYALTDRQPQPGSFAFGFGRAKRLWHFWQVLLCDSHARVPKLERQCEWFVVEIAGEASDRQRSAAPAKSSSSERGEIGKA